MADGRDTAVWTNHANEQWETNKEPHTIEEDYVLRRWLVEVNPKKCLDYGCGGGLWRNLFKGFKMVGCDQNENMIAHAKKRFPKNASSYKVITWNKPEFADASFDLIFTSAVLQHNKHAEKTEVMKELVRMLAPGGHLLCTETTLRPENYHWAFPDGRPFNDDLDDGHSFTQKGWVKYFAQFGLKLVKYEDPGNYLLVKE